MRVLFLGTPENSLVAWLKSQGETVREICERITPETSAAFNPDFIVSYNYRFLIPETVISTASKAALNLHISFLPWNRGADPNPWSHLENTPKGVSIHLLDKGLDTGPLLYQKQVRFGQGETLKSTYDRLQSEIQNLFKEKWPEIRAGKFSARPQLEKGTAHKLADREKFLFALGDDGWNVAVDLFKQRYQDYQNRNEGH